MTIAAVPADLFPPTRASAIALAASSDPEARTRALEQLTRMYQGPVYKHLRLKWRKSPQDAQDLAQTFFVKAIERNIFSSFDPDKARFRTFVRVCLDRIVATEHEASQRQKRGGNYALVPFDAATAEAEIAELPENHDADLAFDAEWAHRVFSLAVERLRATLSEADKDVYFEVFARYDLSEQKSSYAELANELGLKTTDVTNYLSSARRRFRESIVSVLSEVTASESELQQELDDLLQARIG